MEQIKNCNTCAHSTIATQCVRTGYYCDTEMKHGGVCHKVVGGVSTLNLWHPKPPSVFSRLVAWLKLSQKDNQ